MSFLTRQHVNISQKTLFEAVFVARNGVSHNHVTTTKEGHLLFIFSALPSGDKGGFYAEMNKRYFIQYFYLPPINGTNKKHIL